MPSLALLAAGSVKIEGLLPTVLIQLVVIIVAARLFASLARCLKQPFVVGEIAAGIVLGPSCFGRLFPDASAAVFNPAVNDVFGVLSQLGLILLLFVVGLEFDFSHLRWHGKAALAISLAGIALPFSLGMGLAPLMHPYLEPSATGAPVPPLGFGLFMGIAMSITAIPILGRLMMELNITRTRLGAVTISAAAVDDACGWIVLATISSLVQAKFHPWDSLRMVLATIGFFLFLVFVARPFLRAFVQVSLRRGRGELSLNSLAAVLVVLFLCSVATSLIGIFAIFGAFLLGTVLSEEAEFRQVVARHLRDFLTVFFLPIFFTYTGLRTNVGTLTTPLHWLFFAGIMFCAVFGKLGGCTFAARWGGFPRRDALCIGTMMNTRALMELIVINVGRDLGVIPDSVFCMLVLMALLTTVMTTPLLLWLMPGTELEPHIRASGFTRWKAEAPGCALADVEEAI
jgi:Kef-type K+ transport system membrane component KefB